MKKCNISKAKKLDSSLLRGYPGLMTAEQAREALNIGRTGMYKLLKSGEIRSIYVRGKYRIPKPYLLDYINQNTCGDIHDAL